MPVAVNGINGIGMPTDFKTRGFTGGTHGGYNYQMGHWLLGVEADFEYLRSAGSNTVTGFVVPGLPATIATSLGTDWLFTLRPRLGLIFGSWLFYGTGGLAVTRLSANWSFVSIGAAESASASATEPGWAAGGGVETMLPGKITLRAPLLAVTALLRGRFCPSSPPSLRPLGGIREPHHGQRARRER